MKKAEIIVSFEQACLEMHDVCNKIPQSDFYKALNSKWSPAENLRHLTISSKLLSRGVSAPKIGLMYKFGRTFRKSISYNELVDKYIAAQLPSGTITGFEPRFKEDSSKGNEIKEFEKYNSELVKSLARWSEFQLNTYVIPHPLLGKLTLREFLYFMIYHTGHHKKAIMRYFDKNE